MSAKIIITNYRCENGDKYILTAYRQFDRIFDLDFYSADSNDLGNIYVGLVKDLAKNINAAFVEYSKGKIGYLSLTENNNFVFLNAKNTDKLCVGDYILVQVDKEPVKTKDAVLTTNISVTGMYAVCSYGKENLGFSKKINAGNLSNNYSSTDDFKQKVTNIANDYINDKFGFIIRTEAAKSDTDTIGADIKQLYETLSDIINNSKEKKLYTCLYEAKPSYISLIEKSLSGIDMIITDVPEIYDTIATHIPTDKLTLYEDNRISLNSLYGIDTAVSEALGRKVWLKSGGFLIIEPTEAMTVIDVNTGKYEKGKDMAQTFLKINKEAASEIGRQIRLRNLSGIIITDFIDMKEEEHIDELLKHFSEVLSHDPVKTNLVDITKLGLVEITRKKTKMPVHELLKQQNH